MKITDEQRKSDIREVQTYLREVSRINPEIPEIIPDGIYGEETREAVKAFQREYGLPVTGEVNEATWRQLYAAFVEVEAFYAALAGINPFTNRYGILKRGDSGNAIYIIQAMLNTIAQFYTNLVRPAITGVYDNQTEESVKQVQHITGARQTGNIDSDTWNKLAQIYNIHAINDKTDEVPSLAKSPKIENMRAVG